MWSLEAMTDAAEHHQFIYITEEYSRLILITEAIAIWRDNPTVLFHTGYRIAGTPANLTSALSAAAVTQADIDEVLATAIGADDYFNEENLGLYQEELDNTANYQRAAIAANQTAPGVKFSEVMLGQNPAAAATITAAATPLSSGRPLTVAPTKPVRKAPTRASNLGTRIKKLLEARKGQVLDVSGMGADGVGAKTIAVPTARRNSDKFGSHLELFPVVSNNIASYITATRLVGGDLPYSEMIEEVNDNLQRFQSGIDPRKTLVIGRKPKATVKQATPPEVATRTLGILTPQGAPSPTTIYQPYTPPQGKVETPLFARPIFSQRQRQRQQMQTAAATSVAPRESGPATSPAIVVNLPAAMITQRTLPTQGQLQTATIPTQLIGRPPLPPPTSGITYSSDEEEDTDEEEEYDDDD